MTEDLQQLLEKIQRDGVDKAQAEADSITEAAKQKAASLVSAAKSDAEKLKNDAKAEAEAYAARASETISQSARDTLLRIEKSVTALMENLLLKDVDQALNSEEVISALVQDAIKTYLQDDADIEIAASEKMVGILRGQLAERASEEISIVMDETTGSGFRVVLADGRVEHDFTGAAVAEALSKHLRPELKKLLQS